MSTISDLTRACLKELNELITSGAFIQSQSAVPLRAWKDELGRLRLWAGNIGAHQTGQSSLDYRLRDASHIKNQTVRILEAIRKLLAVLKNSLSGEKEDEEDDQLDEDLQSLITELNLDNMSDSVLTASEAHESLVNKVSQLFDISMTVRKPAQQDRLIGTEKSDAEPFKFNFHQHVSHKYPQAENQLVDRISSAMARQRAILKYRERHHLKLSQGLNIDEAGDNTTVQLSVTVASAFKLETPGQKSDDLMSNSDASFTSYAGSLLSGGEKLAIPALPREAAERRPFECPYCYYIITLKDRQAWARHIFRDLSPYICIFSGCSTQNKLYESRKAWYRHIRQTHMASEDVRGSYTCVLCAETLLPMVSFEKHVGRHLEELSLFVLPRGTEDDEVLDDESGNGESEHGDSEHRESDDGGQETENGAQLDEYDDVAMMLNGSIMSFPKGSAEWKSIGVRADENGTFSLDAQDIRPKRDMSGDVLQTDGLDPTDRQESHLTRPPQPDAQTTSRLDGSDPGDFGNDQELLGTVHAATEATGLDHGVVAPEGAEEPETRGRRMSTGGSGNVERHPRARDRAGSRQAAPASASPPRTRRLRQDIDRPRQQEIDRRTDREILRHQEEIERLERELTEYRETHLAREKDDNISDRLQKLERVENAQHLEEIKHATEWHGEDPQQADLTQDYEREISERLRRLERFENTQRLEEEKRKAERRSWLERLGAAESKSSESEEMKGLRLEEEEWYQKAIEEEERMAKESKMKQAAIEEWKLAEIKRRENELNELKEHLRDEFGYTEEEIEQIVRKRAETTNNDKGREEDEQQRRDTWIKVHRKYLLPHTLMAYNLPWDWDENDDDYIIIKQWIAEDMQEELFAHTRRIRESREGA
ncbi:hypothetical protein ASPTUDRAFT_44346 [Aspergillus tubingensis CBS 134.48]|uniref:C2H2-type domain-containing protein n=1 Tax=Aspergillus tubingensis (strain CBS 134.48) TaxID=767770 RepID=A0A1L9N133_ASPTC|nr:hypothetical protein ASPTUDRAFT_44346 [Aspergillus tubingensis CBS 134.48]